MKKLASLTLAVALLFGVYLRALASEEPVLISAQFYQPLYTAQADILNELELFLGTPTGYNLDRIPTRAEAAVMLVRLLGKEQEATESRYEHPFTDVPGWASGAVGYMFENGLTKGVSAELFGADRPCEAKMFATFVLRALGYDDAESDFTYDSAMTAAVSLHVADAALAAKIAGKPFRRDDMAAVSFCGLSANLKGEPGKALLDKLVADGAVSQEKATVCRDAFDAYDAWRKAAYFESQAKECDISLTLARDVDVANQKTSITEDMSIMIQGRDQPASAQMRADVTVKGDVDTVNMVCYLKAGWLYVSKNAPGAKNIKIDVSSMPGTAELMSLLNSLAGTDTVLDPSLLSFATADALSATLVSFTRTTDTRTALYKFGDVPVTFVYDTQGRLQSYETELTMTLGLDGDFSVTETISLEMTINYPSAGVTVDLSGLKESDYAEVSLDDVLQAS